MKPVNNYLKNVMKSVAYAAADVSEGYTGGLHQFAETNREFTTGTYAAIKNPVQFVQKQVEAIQESKIYKALDYGIRNAAEDLRTGNFYNKERKDRDELAFSGLDTNYDDLSEFGIDDDWESKLGTSSSEVKGEVTSGDLKIIDSIEGSNAAVASATVNAVITSSQNEIKNSRANVGIIYAQNERLFGGLHKDISLLGSTMQQIYNLQSASLQNIDKNLSEFFTQESKLSTERNAILKEMLEMQRNIYTSASDKEKEAAAKKKSSRIRWNDINVNGVVDLNAYFGAIKKNINNQLASVMPSGFGEDSNMLATFMTSPLEGVVKYVVDGIIPATVKAATKEFDGTLSGVFGNIIGELGNARSKNEGGLLGLISKFLGVSTNVNRSIDTSRYEKGPIPFDGITRKAIIDVIPTHLRRIEAAVSGRPEEMFDYKAGRWVKVSTVKKQFDDIKKNAVKRATADLRQAMNPGIQAVRKGMDNKADQDSFDKAIEEFEQYLYDNNGRFNPNVSASKNNINAANYPKLYTHYSKIRTIFKHFDEIESKDKKSGKSTTRNVRNMVRMQLSNSVLDAKDSEEKMYREIETDVSNILNSYFGSPKADVHGKTKENGKFEAYSILKTTTDNLGNNIFDYLQIISKELTYIRSNGVYGGGGSGGNNPKNETVSMSTIEQQLKNSSLKSNNLETNRSKDESIKKAALNAITSGKAIDLRDFGVDEKAYLLQLRSMISNNAVTDYKSEIKGYNTNEISNFIDKHLIKTNIKSLKDIDEAIKKAEKEGKNTNEVMDAKEEKFFKKIMNRIGAGEGVLGGIVGASSEAFTNLLYTADKAIYEMMYKTEIDDENKKKYNGFIDAMIGKMTDKFKEMGDTFKKIIIDPFKERLGIDQDFTDRFKDSLMGTGSRMWTAFKDANTSVYGPTYHDMMATLGIQSGETRAQKKRATNRESIKSKIGIANSAKNIYDEKYINILREYGLNFADYKSLDEANAKLLPLLYDDIYRNSNELREFDNDDDTLDYALKALIKDPKRVRRAGTRMGTVIQGNTDEEIIDYIKRQTHNRMDKSDKARRDRQAAVSKAKDANVYRSALAKEYGFIGTVEEKQEMLKNLANEFKVSIKNLSKYDTDDALNKAYIRIIENHNASGTSGIPFSGLTTLTKGEGLINESGVGVVPETGVYNIKSPTHIISNKYMKPNGSDMTIQHDLGKEKLAAKNAGFNIASHAEGTGIRVGRKGDITTDNLIEEAKKFIPEAASGGLIGGIIATLLGIAGGPILGAAVGAGGSILASSDTLKDKLFGKLGTDNKRDGSGIISKSIMDKFNKYFPDMAKYGLAGIIPGLITPLGPIGGLMAGAAFGFIKNNERFTNKYFGEEGKLHIKSKEKKIIEDMLPGALKGAGAGAVISVLFGGPFGLVGNAALGSALGMMASTEDFKNLVLGTEINGERMGGIVGAFKDAFSPFTDALKNSADKLIDAFDTHVINPIANFISPAIHALPIAMGAIPRKLTEIIDEKTRGIRRTLETHIRQFFSPFAKFGAKLLSPATSLVKLGLALPGKALTKAGDSLRAYDIRHGVMPDMNQREAVRWMDETNRGDQVSSTLRASANVGSGLKGSLSVKNARTLMENLNRMNDTSVAAKKNLDVKNNELNKLLVNYRTNDGKRLSKTQIKEIIRVADSGNLEDISSILQDRTLEGSRDGMTKSEFNTFMKEGGLEKALNETVNAKIRLKNIDSIDENTAAQRVQKLLKKAGISEKDFNISSKKDRAKFAALLSDQLTTLDANPDKVVKLETENNNIFKSLDKNLSNVVSLMVAIHQGTDKDVKKAAKKAAKDLKEGQNVANEKFDRRRDNAIKAMGEKEAKKLNKHGEDILTTGNHGEDALKYGAAGVNNTDDGFRNINKIFNKDNEISKSIYNHLTEDAISEISGLSKYNSKAIKTALNQKVIQKAIINGKYKITAETIRMLTSKENFKDLKENCILLAQIYQKQRGKKIYKQYKSLEKARVVKFA